MPSRQKVSSTRVPSCQRCTVVTRAPRGLTFSVNVISIGTDSSGRESSAANLFGIRLSDRPSDRRVGTGAAMNPGNLPDRAGCPERRLTLSMGFATPKINRVSAVKWTRWNTLVVRLEMMRDDRGEQQGEGRTHPCRSRKDG